MPPIAQRSAITRQERAANSSAIHYGSQPMTYVCTYIHTSPNTLQMHITHPHAYTHVLYWYVCTSSIWKRKKKKHWETSHQLNPNTSHWRQRDRPSLNSPPPGRNPSPLFWITSSPLARATRILPSFAAKNLTSYDARNWNPSYFLLDITNFVTSCHSTSDRDAANDSESLKSTFFIWNANEILFTRTFNCSTEWLSRKFEIMRFDSQNSTFGGMWIKSKIFNICIKKRNICYTHLCWFQSIFRFCQNCGPGPKMAKFSSFRDWRTSFRKTFDISGSIITKANPKTVFERKLNCSSPKRRQIWPEVKGLAFSGHQIKNCFWVKMFQWNSLKRRKKWNCEFSNF